MNYATVCSGIEAPAAAWDGLGWHQVFGSEIENFPSAVMRHHKPDVPNHGDMTKYREWPDANIDVLIGGTPCQSFSIAGLRQGLDDPRGNLALVFVGLVERYRPGWVVWENVPGVLSSDEGRDFEAFMRGMAEVGYFGCWRVLDAQWFGVAQRRRRVFAVFCPGDWRPAAAVLFEPESLRGDSAPGRETGQGIAPSVTAGAPFSRTGNERVEAEAMVPDQAVTLGGASHEGGFRTTDLDNSGAFIPEVCGALSDGAHHGGGLNGQDAYTGRILPTYRQPVEGQTPIVTSGGVFDEAVAFEPRYYARGQGGGKGSDIVGALSAEFVGFSDKAPHVFSAMPMNSGKDHTVRETEIAQPLSTAQAGNHNQGGDFIQQATAVRRLTPRECERLQGFPDDYTQVPWRGREPSQCPDGPRYKALGNSMAVPVIRWIGERIQMFESLDLAA